MKRLLLVIAAIAIAGAITAQYRITSGVTDGLEAAKRGMAPYATMTYGDVSTTLEGNIEITDVTFTSRMDNQQIHADKLALVTGSPWALLNMEDTISNHQIPEQLSFVIEGLGVDASFMNGLDKNILGETVFTRFDTAGCGDRTYFDRADLSAMGYDQLIVDMTIGYRLMTGGEEMAVTLKTISRGQTGVEAEMLINLPRPMNDGGPSAELAQGSTLSSATVRVEDLGNNERIVDFCTGETGLTAAEFRDQHLNAWQDEWQHQGLKPSNSLVAVYKDFVTHPGSTLTFTMEPFPALELGSNYLSPDPVYLSGRLNPKLGTGNTGLRPVALSDVPKVERQPSATASSPAASQSEPETASTATQGRTSTGRVSVASLGQHLRDDVRILLINGRRMDGRILAVEGRTLTLKRYLHGGTMVVPVNLGDIRQVSLQ